MLNKKELTKIWAQVPEDYYEKEIAKNLLKRHWHSLKVRKFTQLTKGLKPKTILDDGCASERMANEVSKIYPKAKITAVDVYKKSINYGAKCYPHIKFVQADAHKLPFKNNSFDLVICYEVIEHLVDPEVALNEMRRVVNDKGRVLVAMDSGNWMFRIVWWFAEKTISKVWQGAHLHPFKHTELEQLIKVCGFRIVKKSFSHYGMEVSFLLSPNKSNAKKR